MLAEQLTLPTLSIHTKTREFFKLMFPNMAEYPKRKQNRRKKEATGKKFNREKQFIFIGKKEKMVSVSSLSSLFYLVENPSNFNQYYTNNGFYRSDHHRKENLRYLNSFVIDYDKPGMDVLDMLELIEQTGLPYPTALVSTPSGGWHITYIFKNAIRATYKTQRLYDAIHRHMIADLEGDPHATGVNRVYRIPNDQSLKYLETNHIYDFEVFKEWRNINHPYDPLEGNKQFYVIPNTEDCMMNHAAIQKLLHSPAYIGNREAILFNLCIAMKASDWPIEKAEEVLFHWYDEYCEKHDFTLRDVVYKIRYVYNRKFDYLFPSPTKIEELTGIKFTWHSAKAWEGAKDRKDRERSHLSEWIADLFEILQKNRSIEGTQKQIAERLACPLASMKAVLKLIRSDSRFHVETTLGRNGKTTISLVDPAIEQGQVVIEEEMISEIQENTEQVEQHVQGYESRSKGILSVGNVIYGLFHREEDYSKFERITPENDEEEPPD